MNWKKGFQRITEVLSALILLAGALITTSMVSDVYSNYEYYNSPTFKENPWEQYDPIIQDTAFDPDAYLRKSDLGKLSETPSQEKQEEYTPEILPTILWGCFFSILSAAIPWVLFGIGLYLVRGFKSNP